MKAVIILMIIVVFSDIAISASVPLTSQDVVSDEVDTVLTRRGVVINVPADSIVSFASSRPTVDQSPVAVFMRNWHHNRYLIEQEQEASFKAIEDQTYVECTPEEIADFFKEFSHLGVKRETLSQVDNYQPDVQYKPSKMFRKRTS